MGSEYGSPYAESVRVFHSQNMTHLPRCLCVQTGFEGNDLL